VDPLKPQAIPAGVSGASESLQRAIEHPNISLMSRRIATGVLVITAIGITACGGGPSSTARSSTISSTTSSSSVQISVQPCPVPASDYAGTPYSPQSPSGTIAVPTALAPPDGASLFGSVIAGTPASYLIAPAIASCQGEFGSADAGMIMTATVGSDMSQGVELVLRAGGANAYMSLACPYVPAVQTAEEAFAGSASACSHSSAVMVQQIATGTTNVYAAAVRVPAQVMDDDFLMSGKGNPTVALFTAQVTPPMSADGLMIACTLPSTQQSICDASLRFILANHSGIGAEVGPSNLSQMEKAVSAFVSED
jgi:hypothetical protein